MGNSTEKKAKRARGVVDTPAAVDSLSIEPYVEGLSRFIADCQTPMTIAVQGDWGTGKTNMMLLAERELAPHGHFRLSDPPEDAPAVKATTPHGDPASPIYTIRFNTWQYSQFDMASRLIPSLLENIGAHLLLADPGRGKGDKRAAFLRSLVPVASTAGLSILKAGLGAVGLAPLGVIVNDVHSAYDVSRADRAVTAEDTAAVLMQVKGKFAEAVEELVTPDEADSKASPGRVVVFIDDLDRLEPRKAVELMEALKLFLDVEHCVFILAIDFAVVEQGVGAKYGAAMDRVKARSFFDKIIQVPFQMPTAAYQISGLLDELIKSTGLALKPEDTKTFLELIQLSVGSNPRSIKRLINTFMLLRDIAGIADRIKNGEGRIAEVRNSELFAVLCLQTAYPDAYLDILENGGEDSDLFKHYFLNLDSEDEAHQEAHQAEQATVEWEKKLAEVGIEATGHRFSQLAARIAEVFTAGSEVDSERFTRALSQAVTTSSGMDSQSASSSRGPKAYDSESRHARMRDKSAWIPEESLRLPESFASQVEAHEKVRVGVPFSDVRNWVVELDGKRMGMITVNKNSFHLRLEVRWLTHRQPDVYLQRFQEVFGNDHRFSAEEKAVFIAKIGPDEGEFVDRLARFWLQLIDDELETQKLPATRRAPAATALGLDQ